MTDDTRTWRAVLVGERDDGSRYERALPPCRTKSAATQSAHREIRGYERDSDSCELCNKHSPGIVSWRIECSELDWHAV